MAEKTFNQTVMQNKEDEPRIMVKTESIRSHHRLEDPTLANLPRCEFFEGTDQIMEQLKQYTQGAGKEVKQNEERIREEEHLELPQIYSPWMTSGPKTPILSPAHNFSLQNFGDIDDVYDRSFYIPRSFPPDHNP